jgi:hypothetical protein
VSVRVCACASPDSFPRLVQGKVSDRSTRGDWALLFLRRRQTCPRVRLLKREIRATNLHAVLFRT